jgi:hypothetical protein
MDRPGRHGRPAHAGARRYRPLVTPLGHQIEAALAAGTMPGNEIRERIFPSAIRGGIGLLLRTKRHTATGKQIQVLVAAVNRHMPATPSRCCRRRRGRTRSTFPGGNPGPRAMIPHLPPRPPTSSGSTWRGHGRASTAAMTHLVSSSKSKRGPPGRGVVTMPRKGFGEFRPPRPVLSRAITWHTQTLRRSENKARQR